MRGREEWSLTGMMVPVVSDYRYLGVRLVGGRKGRWKVRREEMLAKARGAFWRAWGLGMAGGWLSASGARGLWQTLVRPVLEYGAEVDSGRWEEAETLQRMAGRMCLGVGMEVPNAVVMGDLGWWTVRARREYLRLVYWGKVVRERKAGVVLDVYEEGRRRMERGEATKEEWCVGTKTLLEQVGLGDRWRTEEVEGESQWKAMVKGMVRVRQEMAWRAEAMTKTTLEAYGRTKSVLKPEWFLGVSRVWVRRWVRLRAGASCLEVSVGRRRRVFRDKRVCGWCKQEVVEDEEHFLDGCRGWRRERKGLWEELRAADARVVRQVHGWSRQQRVDWLLQGGSSKTRVVVLKAVGRWLFAREKAGSGKAGSERWGERSSAGVQSRIAARAAGIAAVRAGKVERRLKRFALAVAAAAAAAAAGAAVAALAAVGGA